MRRDSLVGRRSSLRDPNKARRDSGLPGDDLEREALLRRMSFSTRKNTGKEKEVSRRQEPCCTRGALKVLQFTELETSVWNSIVIIS